MTASDSREAFGLTILKNSHSDIRRIRDKGNFTSLHGNKFWKSSYVLMDYLSECPPDPGMNILEIGCGWGLGGLYCAKHFDVNVTSLDADDDVFPYLKHHAKINGIKKPKTVKMLFEDITEEFLLDYDMVIGADICFWDTLVPAVTQVIDRAMNAGVMRAVITDPGRPTYREMAESFANEWDAVYSDWDVPAPHNVWGLVLDVYNTQD